MAGLIQTYIFLFHYTWTSAELSRQTVDRKNPKISDTRKIAVITLKLEQYCFTTE